MKQIAILLMLIVFSTLVTIVATTVSMSDPERISVIGGSIINAVAGAISLVAFVALIAKVSRRRQLKELSLSRLERKELLGLLIGLLLTNVAGFYFCGFSFCFLLPMLNMGLLAAWLVGRAVIARGVLNRRQD